MFCSQPTIVFKPVQVFSKQASFYFSPLGEVTVADLRAFAGDFVVSFFAFLGGEGSSSHSTIVTIEQSNNNDK